MPRDGWDENSPTANSVVEDVVYRAITATPKLVLVQSRPDNKSHNGLFT